MTPDLIPAEAVIASLPRRLDLPEQLAVALALIERVQMDAYRQGFAHGEDSMRNRVDKMQSGT